VRRVLGREVPVPKYREKSLVITEERLRLTLLAISFPLPSYCTFFFGWPGIALFSAGQLLHFFRLAR
jgi:hypothetical protein